jgi:hypothetical protein
MFNLSSFGIVYLYNLKYQNIYLYWNNKGDFKMLNFIEKLGEKYFKIGLIIYLMIFIICAIIDYTSETLPALIISFPIAFLIVLFMPFLLIQSFLFIAIITSAPFIEPAKIIWFHIKTNKKGWFIFTLILSSIIPIFLLTLSFS